MNERRRDALRILGFKDRDSDEPLHVLDLPQLYQKPSFTSLRAILDLLDLPPSSFSTQGPTTASQIHPEGITTYLTSIISSSLHWLLSDDDRELIWDAASHCLSQRSGRTAMGALTRDFLVPTTSSGGSSITITLHEPALTEDNLGLKTWSSSYVLAKKLCTLHLPSPTSPSHAGATPILELGAGTGLVGLAAAAVWDAPVILTDLPEIVPNLAKNVDGNAHVLAAHSSKARAVAGVLDWTAPSKLSLRQDSGPEDIIVPAKVTTIFAADPIYSPDHPRLLVNAVSAWLDRGRAEEARLVLAYPIREAYLPQIADLRERLEGELGLQVMEQGEEITRDDWSEDVRVCWSVWGWAR